LAYILILLTVFSAGAGSGYWMAHENSQAKIIGLQSGIDKGNAEAAAALIAAGAEVAKAETETIDANKNLDLAHVQDIQTINILYDDRNTALAIAERLREYADHKGCPDPVPKSPDPGQYKNDDPNRAEFSKLFGIFLDAEAFRADTCAIDKNLLLKFVNEQNCGIK
jgi:hypothetical protein